MPEKKLAGRVAFITGATRGLGKQIACAYAEHGASIIVASRKEDACTAVAEELHSEFGVATLPLKLHVGMWEDCDRAVEAALARFGRVDILVNNAGMSPLYKDLPSVTEELFDKVVAVNLRGPFRLSALLGTHMRDSGGGTIINISSVSSVQPGGNEIVYGAAKAALNALSQSLAHTMGPTVRVNTIMPGPFLTDISEAWDMDAFAKHARRNIALGRGGQPHEITGAAVYLASDDASFTTGAVIRVDGGYAWAAS